MKSNKLLTLGMISALSMGFMAVAMIRAIVRLMTRRQMA